MKLYILDTNVLVHDVGALDNILQNGENRVILPMIVLDELDRLKIKPGQLGYNARKVIHKVESLVDENKIEVHSHPIIKDSIPDDYILATMRDFHDDGAILISKDVALRVRAKARGYKTEDYIDDKISSDNFYTGISISSVSNNVIEKFYSNVDTTYPADSYPNHATLLTSELNEKSGVLVVNKNGNYIAMDNQICPFELEPANLEQTIAANHLLDNDIKLMTLAGQAGTGKTLIALACALELVLERKEYDKVTIARPIMPFQKDLGFLPGEASEKISPWLAPIKDNTEFLFNKSKHKGKDIFQHLLDVGTIEACPLTYIRGRSLPNQILMIDECFPYKQKIVTEDSNVYIGSLFHAYIRGDKLPKVRSFNTDTNTFEYKSIKSVSHKGIKPLVQIISGAKKIKCTDNHPFLTATKGWVKAKELEIGDPLVMSGGKNHQNCNWLNEDQLQIIIGSRLGDGSIKNVAKDTYRVTINHGDRQESYLKEKAAAFNRQDKVQKLIHNGYSDGTLYQFTTNSFALPEKLLHPRGEDIDDWMLDKINAKGLAVFYMDDGSFEPNTKTACLHINSFNDCSATKISAMLKNKFGIDNNMRKSSPKGRGKTYNYIYITVEGTKKLLQTISPYLSECCRYKTNLDFTAYTWNNESAPFAVSTVTGVKSLEESQHVFDMEVEDNHNFIASVGYSPTNKDTGYVVHNCQNLTTAELKTILTRAGEGTKVILTGDPFQLDNPYLSSETNGLVYCMDKFKSEPIAANVFFSKCERSKLATIAAEIL